jgi:hypothetical protein
MMKKLMLACATVLISSAAVAAPLEPILEDPTINPMAEDLCSRDGYCQTSPPPKPPAKPHQ